MFKTDYNKKFQKLIKKKTAERDLFLGLLDENKKAGKVSEKAEKDILKIIEEYNLLLQTCNDNNIDKEKYTNYKFQFKEILNKAINKIN